MENATAIVSWRPIVGYAPQAMIVILVSLGHYASGESKKDT